MYTCIARHMYALDALPFFVRAQPPLSHVREGKGVFNVNDITYLIHSHHGM